MMGARRRHCVRLPAAGGRILLVVAALFGLFGPPIAPSAHADGPTKTVTTGPSSKTLDDSDPINMATGEYFFLLDLVSLGGPLPLDFRLYYGSQAGSKRLPDGFPSLFTGNRRGTLAIDPGTSPRSAFVELGLGDEIGFFDRGFSWETFNINATRYQLTETTGAFYMLDPVKSLVYTFAPTTTTVPLDFTVAGMASLSSSSALGNNGSRTPAISGDGRYVAFGSDAGNLVDGDTNGVTDVFVRDLQTGQTTRVSISSTGAEANGASLNPAISSDGRYVSFQSSATNLVEGDSNGFSDVFVHDRQTATTTRVSVSSAGVQGNDNSSLARISADGRYVTFVSSASNLVDGDTNGYQDVFVRDRQTGQTTRVNVASDGTQANFDGRNPAISGDGRYVAFHSSANNLVAGKTSALLTDVFVHDRETRQTTRVSVSSAGAEGSQNSSFPALSYDGRYVAFESRASTLVDGDTNNESDIFVRDRQTNQTTRVNVSSTGAEANGLSLNAAISNDGRYVAFQSCASNLVAEDINGKCDVFLHDRTTGETIRVSQTRAAGGDQSSSSPSISADGRRIAFFSDATNLVDGDTNASQDVFVARQTGPSQAFLVRVQDRNGNTLTYANPANIDKQGPTRVEDGFGRAITMTYATVGITDTSPYVTKIEDQTGRAWTLGYENSPPDNPGKVTLRSIADPLGNTRTFRYGGNHFITAQVMPLGNVPYTQTYNTSFPTRGVVAAQRDAYSNTTTITADSYPTFQAIQSRFTITYPDGTHRIYTHTHTGRVIESMTDQAGQTIRFQPETADRLTGVTDRLGATTTITYDLASGQLGGFTNARGNTTALTYTTQTQTFTNPDNGEQLTFAFQSLTGIGYADGTRESLGYDARGNLLTRTDRAGSVWTYAYNSRGQVLSETNPSGGVRTYTYNADGTLATGTDSDTGTTTCGYDALKRLTSITHPDGTRVQYTYDALDRITSTTDENNRTTTYTYDANGNRIRVTDAAGNVTRYEYDLLDRAVRVTDRLTKTATVGFDTVGRTAAMTDATGVAVQLGYDPRGWANQVTRDGHTWRTEYDAEGVPVTRTTPTGRATRDQTDQLGQVTGLIDPLGNVASLTRDALNRPVQVTDPLSRSTSYAYDARGLLTGVTRSISGTASYQRDGLGKVARITDLNGRNWDLTYTPMGRLRTIADPNGRTITNTYDTRGRLAGVTYPDGGTLTYGYDAAGNVTRRQYSDGTDLQFSYDALNRLTAAGGLALSYDAEGRITSTTDGSTSFGASYDDAGRLKTATYNNGTFAVTYTYSPTTGLLMRVADSLTGTRVDFRYDGDFRLVGLARSNGIATTYTLDDAGRVTRIQDGAFLDLQYTLDASGQTTGVVMTAPLDPAGVLPPASSALSYDAASQLSATGYAYDSRGRLTAGSAGALTWDGASRLTGTSGVTLTYNGLNDVRTRAAAGSTAHFHYNAGIGLRPIVAERDEASGQFQRYYVWTPDGRLLYGIDAANGNKVFFYHFDRTGSTLALTDGFGAVADAYAYTPYGQVLGRTGSSPQPFTFVGQYGVRQEGASGTLYQMRARYYDAGTGRFLSRESLWPRLADAALLNPYQYARDEPVRNVDPTGLEPDLSELLKEYERLSEEVEFWDDVWWQLASETSALESERFRKAERMEKLVAAQQGELRGAQAAERSLSEPSAELEATKKLRNEANAAFRAADERLSALELELNRRMLEALRSVIPEDLRPKPPKPPPWWVRLLPKLQDASKRQAITKVPGLEAFAGGERGATIINR